MIDYKAIADRAFEIGGTTNDVFEVMKSETETVVLTDNWETRLAILSRLGIAQGAEVLARIEAAVEASPELPDIIIDMIRSERGVNLADPETIGLVNMLVSVGALSQEQADALLATNTSEQLRFPGLRAGHVADAVRMRYAGEV